MSTVELRSQVFSKFCVEGRTFVLRKPIVAAVERDMAGYWAHSCEELGLLSYGQTEESSSEEFAKEFAFTWDGLANEPDSMLTEDAKRLKLRLQGIVDYVEND